MCQGAWARQKKGNCSNTSVLLEVLEATMIRIAEVLISNFRCFKEIRFHPRNTCLLIGENDSGKTAVLHAVRMVLGHWKPMPDDLYAYDPDLATKDREPLEIELILAPADPQKGFTDDEHAVFFEHFDIADDGNEQLRIKLRYGWDAQSEEFRTQIRFQKKDGDGDDFTARYGSYFGFFLIDALRDIGREIGNKTGLWGRLLSSITLSDAVQHKVTTLFNQANDALQNDPSFAAVKDRFEDLIEDVLGLPQDGENVRMSPVPQEAAELLRGADLHVRSKGSTMFLPITRHGMGSQSTAVIALFRTWVEHRDIPNMFFGFEEPEAHLHPHIQRYLYKKITDLGSQVFLTTHSTFIADRADLRDIVLLRRIGSQWVARQLPNNDPAEPGKSFLPSDLELTIKRYIEGNNSEIFFARSLLLVEGDSERYALPLFARAMDIDFNYLGISLVWANSSNFLPFIRICSPQAFDIPWTILCDGDATKKVSRQLEEAGYISKGTVKKVLKSGNLINDVLVPHDCYSLPDNLEHFLIYGGFLDDYSRAIEEQDGPDALTDYIQQRELNESGFKREAKEKHVYDYVVKHGKPRFARLVAERISSNGTDTSRIPEVFKGLLQTAKMKAETALSTA